MRGKKSRKKAANRRAFNPSRFAGEIEKVGPGPKFVAVHVKAPYRAEVGRELQALGRKDLEVPGRTYTI